MAENNYLVRVVSPAEDRRARQMKLLADIARQLAGSTEPQLLLAEAARRLGEDFGFDLVSIFLIEGNQLFLQAADGAYSNLLQPGMSVLLGQGIAGWVGQSGQTYCTNHAQSDNRFAPLAGIDTAAEIAVPLRLADKVVGVLDIQDERADSFDSADISTLETLADLLAAALQSGRLFAELNARERLAEALRRVGAAVNASLDLPTVLDTICTETQSAFGADVVSVWLIEDGAEALRLTAAHGPTLQALLGHRVALADKTSIAARAVREHRPIFLGNLQNAPDGVALLKSLTGVQSLLAVPIIKEDQPLGALVIIDSRNPQRFGEADVAAATLLGAHLATAISNARHFAEAQRRAAQLGLLYDVSQKVSGSLEEIEILQRTMIALVERFGFNEAAVMAAVGKDELELMALAASEEVGLSLGFRQKMGQGIIGHVAQSRATYIAQDISTDPYYWNLLERKAGSALAVPILREGNLLGVLYIENSRVGAFSREDVLALETLSSHIATSMENARLYARANERVRQMTALQSLSQAVISSLELSQIFQTIVNLLHLAFNYKYVIIGLVEHGALRPGAQVGYPPGAADVALSISHGVDGRAIGTGQIQFVADVAADPDYINAIPDIQSLICVPLLNGQTALGVLDVASTSNRPLTEADVDLLSLFAGQATAAIHNAQLYKDSQRRADTMAALHANSVDISVTQDLSALLHTIVERAAKLLQAPSGGLYLCDLERREARCVVSYNTAQDFRGTVLKYGDGAAGKVAVTGQPLIIDDYRTWPGRAAVYEKAQPFISVLSVPMIWKDQTIGVIHVEHHAQANFFTQDDLSLMILFSNQAAVAVENARLLDETNRAAEEQRLLFNATRDFTAGLAESEVLHAVASHLVNVIHVAECNILRWERATNRVISLLDYNGKEFASSRASGPNEDLDNYPATRQVLESRQPLLVREDDPQGDPAERALMRQWSYTSLLMVPLFTGGQTFGVVELYRNASQPVFTDSEVQLAQSLAAQASVAIFNARLMAETRRRAEEQSVLFQAVRDFTSALDERAIFEAIAHHMISALGLACCAISRWDKTNNQLVTLIDLDITHTFDVDETGATYDLADYSTTRRVLETRQAVIIRITDPDVDPQEYAFIQKMGFEAVLLMPLMARKEVIGLIELYPAPGTSPFSESALQLADSLNAQAAIALDNARLHATAKDQVRDLDALLAANTALLSTLDLDPLLHNILTAAIGTIRAAEKGTILLIESSSGQLQIRAVSGYSDPRVKNLAFAGSDGYSAQAVRERRPLLISDARADSSTRYEGDIPEVRGIHSAIVAPLLFEEFLLGAIALDSSRRQAFTEADLKLLVAFASTAAASINHARLHAEAQTRAATDGPTGLANRRAFDHALEAEVSRAGRHGYPLSLLILDIDSFKLYNDAFGHPAGDERIKAIADLLMRNMRGPDIAARYGGEEFAVILPHTNKSGALTLAERIRAAARALAPAPASGNQPVPGYTLSIGVATLPEDGLTPGAILLAADNAELASKRAGKNCVTAAPAIS